MESFSTPITKLFGIKHPIVLAGMNAVAHAKLVAAVSNAGGLGVIGGLTFTPKMLRKQIAEVKEYLHDKRNPKFGVDLAIPQLGGSARKTNYDYTHGHLDELIDIIVEEGASLFVCAVGVPPKRVIDKLHRAGIPVMNMVGAPKHVDKALDAGVDIICAQGTEGGGHTGAIASSVLIPICVDKCSRRRSPLTGETVQVIAAGGIFDGRGLAAALSWGASAVWVGTRFIAAEEAAAPPRHQNAVLKAKAHETTTTLIYSGRPLRVYETPYVKDWNSRAEEVKRLCAKGILPFKNHMDETKKKNPDKLGELFIKGFPFLMGQGAAGVHDIRTAKEIVEGMVSQAVEITRRNSSSISRL